MKLKAQSSPIYRLLNENETTFYIHKVSISIKKCYKYSLPCTFDFVQLVKLRSILKNYDGIPLVTRSSSNV